MNSLKTQDILGAQPTVRHMPINLLRERKIPTAFNTNMHPDFKASMLHDLHAQQYPCYPSNQRFNPNVHQMPYQNLSPNDYPVPAHKRMRKLPKRTNYDFSQMQENHKSMQKQQEKAQLPRIQSEIAHLPKVRQLQVKQRQNPQTRQKDRQNKSMENAYMQKMDRSNSQSHYSRKNSAQRQQLRNSRQNQQKKLFRGLGFNIITNRNYNYLFQYRNPSILS